MEKYRIISRYEWYSPSGLTWTKWYQEPFYPLTDCEDELKEKLKELNNSCKDIEKKLKRKSEHKIEKFEFVEIELKNLPKAERKHRVKKTK